MLRACQRAALDARFAEVADFVRDLEGEARPRHPRPVSTLVAIRCVLMRRTIVISLLVAGCAIKPPPAEPSEPPETWAKRSIQRDCEHECSVSGEHRARCMARCESPPTPLRCGGYIDPHRAQLESGLPRSVAIAIVVGWLVATTLAIGTH